MALMWQIPYELDNNEIIVSSLNVKTLFTDKHQMEIDLTNELNNKNVKVNWTELDEENKVLIVPNHKKVLELILEIEPIERNPKKKSFDGKIVTPTPEEALNYGY